MKLVSYKKDNKINIGALENEIIIPFQDNSNIPKDMLSFIEKGNDSLNMAKELILKSKIQSR